MEARRMMRTMFAAIAMLAFAGLSGCAPEVGSEAWCKKLDEKPKGDWTANEAADYAKHCIFRKSK
jgi:Protein of unknown function (DUF3012)